MLGLPTLSNLRLDARHSSPGIPVAFHRVKGYRMTEVLNPIPATYRIKIQLPQLHDSVTPMMWNMAQGIRSLDSWIPEEL